MTRLVECDDQAFAELVGEGGPYDYELGERYIVAPATGGRHGSAVIIVGSVLRSHFATVASATNLGRLGEPGTRWYVVPDVVVLADDADLEADAYLAGVVAVEIRSPREDPLAKLAAYRQVMERTGLQVGEVWYVEGATVTVHPRAGIDPGPTEHPEALTAVTAALRDL